MISKQKLMFFQEKDGNENFWNLNLVKLYLEAKNE